MCHLHANKLNILVYFMHKNFSVKMDEKKYAIHNYNHDSINVF